MPKIWRACLLLLPHLRFGSTVLLLLLPLPFVIFYATFYRSFNHIYYPTSGGHNYPLEGLAVPPALRASILPAPCGLSCVEGTKQIKASDSASDSAKRIMRPPRVPPGQHRPTFKNPPFGSEYMYSVAATAGSAGPTPTNL